MSEPQEFKITIGRDGRIRLDFRGMKASSYRRIIEFLEETVGAVESVEEEAREVPPPDVVEDQRARADESDEEMELEDEV